jgi:hypothetical protein
MVVLEFLMVSCVGGVILAFALRKYDNWRERVQTRKTEEALKEE